MANPSNSVFLSCGDSGLSVTASVAGILTFAYAIAAGTLFYASIAKEAPKRRSRVEKAVKEAEFRLQRFARVGEEAQHTFLDGKEIEPEQHSRWMFLYHNWMAQYHHWYGHSTPSAAGYTDTFPGWQTCILKSPF